MTLGARLRTPEAAVVIGICVLALASVSDTMRESDQASLLDGAIALARGDATPWSADFYNYDRQFLSYWVVAATLAAAASVLGEVAFENGTMVHVTNLTASLVLWVGVTLLVVTRARGDRLVSVLLLAILVSPTLLLNSALLCSNIISAGCLAGLAALLDGRARDGVLRLALVAVITFAAVGARADAALCLPFLCWISVPASRWRALLLRAQHWAAFFGAALALVVGEWVMRGESILFYPSPLVARIVLAYATFGLGAAIGVGGLLLALLWWRIARATAMSRRLFFVAGLVFSLLPLAFYGPQLVSPRHLLTTVWVLLFFVVARRGRALMKLGLGASARALVAGGALLLAVVPLVVGIHLPAVSAPRLVVKNATLYPTADGLWPMGAYVDFVLRLRRASLQPVDHNQEIWGALARTELPSAAGEVPLYWTPMLSYFKLAATLQGKLGAVYPLTHYGSAPFLIGDERALRKYARPFAPGEKTAPNLQRLLAHPKSVVSPRGAAQAILRIDIDGNRSKRSSHDDVERRLVLASCFGGDEYGVRALAGRGWRWRESDRGKTMVFFSDAPFEAVLRSATEPDERLSAARTVYAVPNGELRGLYYVKIDSHDTLTASSMRVRGAAEEVFAAQAVLPGYMSVARLR